MSLDLSFRALEPITCPKCGDPVTVIEVDNVCSGGRGWYPILTKLGYYVPYDQRTEANNWYGKDMTLSDEQVTEVRRYLARNRDLYYGNEILALLNRAEAEGLIVILNADW